MKAWRIIKDEDEGADERASGCVERSGGRPG